jgi:hypothetical protein
MAAAALRGLVGDGRLGLRHAGMHQHHRRHRRREAQAHHLLYEAAPRQRAAADVFDQVAQFTFLHRVSPGVGVVGLVGWGLRCVHGGSGRAAY